MINYNQPLNACLLLHWQKDYCHVCCSCRLNERFFLTSLSISAFLILNLFAKNNKQLQNGNTSICVRTQSAHSMTHTHTHIMNRHKDCSQKYSHASICNHMVLSKHPWKAYYGSFCLTSVWVSQDKDMDRQMVRCTSIVESKCHFTIYLILT